MVEGRLGGVSRVGGKGGDFLEEVIRFCRGRSRGE